MIIKNAIRCNHCGDIIESKHVHDFKLCSCGCVSVDGGTEYLRRSFHKEGDYAELSETVLTLDEAIDQAENCQCSEWKLKECMQVAEWLRKAKNGKTK